MDIVGQEDVVRDIVLDELVVFVAGKMLDVGGGAGEKIVNADDAESFGKEAIGEVRAEEPCGAGNHCGAFCSHWRQL